MAEPLAEINIGCLTYTVQHGPSSALGDALGLTDHDTQTIWLDPDCPPGQRLAVLFHEIVHVGMLAYGHNVPGAAPPTFCEERAAAVAGAALAEAFLRCPDLVDLVAALSAGEEAQG